MKFNFSQFPQNPKITSLCLFICEQWGLSTSGTRSFDNKINSLLNDGWNIIEDSYNETRDDMNQINEIEISLIQDKVNKSIPKKIKTLLVWKYTSSKSIDPYYPDSNKDYECDNLIKEQILSHTQSGWSRIDNFKSSCYYPKDFQLEMGIYFRLQMMIKMG